MNNPTGMRRGARYVIEQVDGAPAFSGFFLDGKYFLHPELLTAIGWIDADRFMFDQVSSTGEPAFPGRLAGTINDLTLKLEDGTSLNLAEVELSAHIGGLADETVDQPEERFTVMNPTHPAFLLATTATLLVVGYIAGRLLDKRRGR
jgi:hypothetical protein